MTRWWAVFSCAAVLEGTVWTLFGTGPLTGLAWWGAFMVWMAGNCLTLLLVGSPFYRPLWKWMAGEW